MITLEDCIGLCGLTEEEVLAVAEHEQLGKRGRWRQVGTEAGPVPALLPPALAVGWPVVSGRVPALGEDTDAIKAEVSEPKDL